MIANRHHLAGPKRSSAAAQARAAALFAGCQPDGRDAAEKGCNTMARTRPRANAQALAASPKTFEQRDDWMRAVLASDLPPVAARFAICIALRLNVESRQCNPSFATLAADSHVGERSAYRLVTLLEHAGWIAVQRTRGRLSNQYVLLNPANSMAGFNPAKSDAATLPKRPRNPANRMADEKRNRILDGERLHAPPSRGRESVALTREDAPDDPGRAALRAAAGSEDEPEARVSPRRDAVGPNDAAPSENNKENSGDTVTSGPNGPSVAALDQERAWRELSGEIWRRGWASDDTPKALAIGKQVFTKACREGVHTAHILEGARTWIAAADAPRYLPALPQWLAAKGWRRPPPTKRKTLPHGGGKSPRRDHRRNGNKIDATRIAFMQGGYVEGADGRLYHPDGDEGSCLTWRAAP
jgi:hypothetical protein